MKHIKEKRFYYKGKLVRRSRTDQEFRYGLLKKEQPKAEFYALAEDRERLEAIKDREIGWLLRDQKDKYDMLARVLRGEPSSWCNWSERTIRGFIDSNYKNIEEVRNWQIVKLDERKEK